MVSLLSLVIHDMMFYGQPVPRLKHSTHWRGILVITIHGSRWTYIGISALGLAYNVSNGLLHTPLWWDVDELSWVAMSSSAFLLKKDGFA